MIVIFGFPLFLALNRTHNGDRININKTWNPMKNQLLSSFGSKIGLKKQQILYFSFQRLKIENINRYGKEGFEIHGREEGTVMTVSFRITDNLLLLWMADLFLNLMKQSHFRYLAKPGRNWLLLEQASDEGQEGQCGWLKDKFGIHGRLFLRYSVN